jgi:hypothetical protein
MNRGSLKKAPFLVIGILFCFLFFPVSQGYGDGYKGEKHGIKKAYEHSFKKGDHGDETTGEIAAWMFGVANFPVALSIILKTLARFIPLGLNLRDPLTKFNRQQKKYLMKLHYWLNPIALGVALTHLALSTCRSTAFPEWGLGIMLVTVLLGLMMKFKLSPASMRQRVFRFHTSPILLLATITILLIGHTIAD